MKRYEYNKIIRTILGISVNELAMRVGFTKAIISGYEKGILYNEFGERRIELKLNELLKICKDELTISCIKDLISKRDSESE